MADVIMDEKIVERPDMQGVVRLDDLDEQLIGQLVDRARSEGLRLTGQDGLLAQLTKRIIESAAEGEMDVHLGYAKHEPAGRDGGNSRNGARAKTVIILSRRIVQGFDHRFCVEDGVVDALVNTGR